MPKFDINKLMNAKSQGAGRKDTAPYKVVFIPLNKIVPSDMNKYSVADVSDLKASVELVGLIQPLAVREKEGADLYEIVSGHRRHKALSELCDAGNEQYEQAPCYIRNTASDVETEMALIFANSTSRQLTDYERTYQAARIKELRIEQERLSGEKITGRKREVIAAFLNVSPAQVGRMESIEKNLSPELKDEFKGGNINITAAYEASRLPAEQQAEALKEHQEGKPLTPDAAKKKRQPKTPKKEKTAPLPLLSEKDMQAANITLEEAEAAAPDAILEASVMEAAQEPAPEEVPEFKDTVKEYLVQQTAQRLRDIVTVVQSGDTYDMADICKTCAYAADILEGLSA